MDDLPNLLSVGDTAPNFSLKDQNGIAHSLGDYAGRFVLLYFYPKDDTPGCTVEACGMRDRLPDFEKRNAFILGVSADSTESHSKFSKKFSLTFPLLADTGKTISKAYGVIGTGVRRISFLIDPKGVIVKVYRAVKPEIHTKEVLTDLKSLV